MWRARATRLAEALVKTLGITSLPVNPFTIAEAKGIAVEGLPPDRKGVSGMLLKRGNDFGILYATYLGNPGFEHFSVSHELGHYHLPGHADALLTAGMHRSLAGFRSSERHELEADHFAAGLLMPGHLFDRELQSLEIDLTAIQGLAERCVTSLTATAIRVAQRADDPLAIVMSQGDHIDYCFMSAALAELPGIQWPKKGSALPKDSCTRRLNGDAAQVSAGARFEAPSDVMSWLGGSLSLPAYEECQGLGQYGKTLTLLTVDAFPDLDEIEEEEALHESWEPRFR